ncbi:hypothetical protein AAG570_005639 [Ranatra chinensis]|uniref:DUF4485 domain-containing protein n=1 Tax=Ranatra chinensis TaxID=642074 RepID=A0ABD0YJS8_9HEMI
MCEEEYRVLSDRIMSNANGFSCEDKESIMCWLVRLNQKARDAEEASRIVEYARYLNHMTSKGMLHYPFTGCPPCKKLPPLENYFKNCRSRSSSPRPDAPCDWTNNMETPSNMTMTVGEFVDSIFELGGPKGCPLDEAVGRVFEEMFDAPGEDCPVQNRTSGPQAPIALPDLDQVLDMNLECLQSEIIKELETSPDPSRSVRLQTMGRILINRVSEQVGDCPPSSTATSPCSKPPEQMCPEELAEEFLTSPVKSGSRFEEVSFRLHELFDRPSSADGTAPCPSELDYSSSTTRTCPNTFNYSSSTVGTGPDTFEYDSEAEEAAMEEYCDEEYPTEEEPVDYSHLPILQRPEIYRVPRLAGMSPIQEVSAEDRMGGSGWCPSQRSNQFSSEFESGHSSNFPPGPDSDPLGIRSSGFPSQMAGADFFPPGDECADPFDIHFSSSFGEAPQPGGNYDDEFFGDAGVIFQDMPDEGSPCI